MCLSFKSSSSSSSSEMVCDLSKQQKMTQSLCSIKRVARDTLQQLIERDEKVDVVLCCMTCRSQYEFKNETLFRCDSIIYTSRFLYHFLTDVTNIDASDTLVKYEMKDLVNLHAHIRILIEQHTKRVEKEQIVKSTQICSSCCKDTFLQTLEYRSPSKPECIEELSQLINSISV